MALSQSALSELLKAFRAGDGVDLIRVSRVKIPGRTVESVLKENLSHG
ncbi:hypothetical protein GCM10027517_33580 [Phycicoccus ginsengisoli]